MPSQPYSRIRHNVSHSSKWRWGTRSDVKLEWYSKCLGRKMMQCMHMACYSFNVYQTRVIKAMWTSSSVSTAFYCVLSLGPVLRLFSAAFLIGFQVFSGTAICNCLFCGVVRRTESVWMERGRDGFILGDSNDAILYYFLHYVGLFFKKDSSSVFL